MDIEQLIETWRGPLTGLVAGWGASWTDAAELAQDTLVEAYLQRGRLRGDPNDAAVLGPWLSGVARNKYRNWSRKQGRRREENLAVDTASPESADEVDDQLGELREAMARLPEPLRTVLYLHYLEDIRVREVAALLDVPEKTVEGRLHRARERLREHLERAAAARASNSMPTPERGLS